MIRSASNLFIFSALLALAAVTLTAPAGAQQGEGWEWISPLGFEPGSPPVVEPLEGNESVAVFRVTLPGFWLRERLGPDQVLYSELDFPGLGETQQMGAPKLPLVNFDLAVPTTAEQVQAIQVEYGEVFRYEMTVYPRTIPERDHEEGDPEVFVMDERVYGGQEPFPLDVAPPAAIDRNGPIPFARVGFAPCVWSPADGLLEFASEFIVVYDFGGSRIEPGRPTLERDRQAAAVFENWGWVLDYFQPNVTTFEADYLFVYPGDLRPELKPLIDQKKARGYLVAEVTVESTGGTCEGVRGAIQDWYSGTPFWRDRYCLLVGDVDLIPLCDSPVAGYGGELIPTDDLYASPVGDDLDEEVYLGRLSIEGAEDLAVQVDKILQYEDHAMPFVDYRNCGLAAHKEGAPGKYEGAHESVRTAAYAVPPAFATFYGSAGAGDADVVDYIDQGVGIVAYRGHGSATAWTGWNTGFDYFDLGDINALGNGRMTPVIWSFACNNNELDYGFGKCVGENWLSRIEGGAVAHYGSTVPSWTSQNHELDRAMFRAVWHYGLVTHAQAIMTAEDEMASAVGPDNAWMYLLLGDPDMKIRRSSPPAWTLVVPDELPVCVEGFCNLEIQVFDDRELPLSQVLVSVWKGVPEGAKAGDEVFANGYTDSDGRTLLTVAPATEGTLALVARDIDGNAFVYDIPVVASTTSVPAVGLEPLRLTAAPSVTTGATSFRLSTALAAGARVEIYDTRGRMVRALDLGPSAAAVSWDGRDGSGRSLASGVYYARVSARGQTSTTRVLMVR